MDDGDERAAECWAALLFLLFPLSFGGIGPTVDEEFPSEIEICDLVLLSDCEELEKKELWSKFGAVVETFWKRSGGAITTSLYIGSAAIKGDSLRGNFKRGPSSMKRHMKF